MSDFIHTTGVYITSVSKNELLWHLHDEYTSSKSIRVIPLARISPQNQPIRHNRLALPSHGNRLNRARRRNRLSRLVRRNQLIRSTLHRGRKSTAIH